MEAVSSSETSVSFEIDKAYLRRVESKLRNRLGYLFIGTKVILK